MKTLGNLMKKFNQNSNEKLSEASNSTRTKGKHRTKSQQTSCNYNEHNSMQHYQALLKEFPSYLQWQKLAVLDKAL
jgi:hypothetical protein